MVWALALACTGERAEEPVFDEALAAELQAALEAGTLAIGAPGAVAAVASADLGTWRGSTGTTDLSSGVDMAVGDAFRIGSMTKTFVAALVLQDAGDGRIDLDAAVAGWLPELLARGDEITVRMALNHTSGLPDYTETDEFLLHLTESVDPLDVVAWADADEDLFEPGQGWSYSNTNYFVLGLLLEALHGVGWEVLLSERIREPLGLAETWVEHEEPAALDLVPGHVGGVEVSGLYDGTWGWASGGMVSTTRDVVTWMQALLGGQVLDSHLLDAMRTPTQLPDGTTASYGLGWYVLTDESGALIEGHTGSTMGFQSDMFATQGTDEVVVVLANDFAAETTEVSDALREVLAGR